MRKIFNLTKRRRRRSSNIFDLYDLQEMLCVQVILTF
jgi:hypothetical protein